MQYSRNYNFAAGTEIVADQVDLEFDSIATVVNTGIDTANIVDGAITADKMATNINPETRAAEIFVDGVYTGLTLTPTSGWSNRVATINAGTSYIRGRRVSTSAQTDHSFTASKDTYVDLDKNMNFTYKEETLGAAEPAVTANSVRIMKVVTDGTKITAWYDRRPWQWITVGAAGGPAFSNSWVNFGSTYAGAAFIKDQLGWVHLRGLVKSGTVDATMFNLPAGFRPLYDLLVPGVANSAAAGLGVSPAGNVREFYGSNAWIGLECVSFKAEA